MRLYIDPSTGSMLFAILIGLAGALYYVFRVWLVKLRFLLSGGKKVESNIKKIPYVIYSDNKRYWSIFEPLCRIFNERGIDVVYMTASSDDPVFSSGYEHIKGEFIGSGNLGFAKLNFINASIVLSTTPGLDVYQWKRSRNVDCYVHIPHALGEITTYRMFGLDYYDALLLSSKYQVDCIRKLEALRKLPEKEICIIGLPYMDEMVNRFKNTVYEKNDITTVLLAPSWGSEAIFSKYGERIIDELLKTGYKIIIRPHPQSFDSEKELLDRLMNKYPNSDAIEWNRDVDNFNVLLKSDILISDFSGVVFEFALVYGKPIIYADTSFDKGAYDAWWLDDELWTFKSLPKIGVQLTEDRLSSIKECIDNCLNSTSFKEGREELIAEAWENYGEGSEIAVDWLINKYSQLTEENKEESIENEEMEEVAG